MNKGSLFGTRDSTALVDILHGNPLVAAPLLYPSGHVYRGGITIPP